MRSLLLCALLFTATPAYAYLDPGTGSMLLYFILGVVATCAYYTKEAFYKLQLLFSGGKLDKSLAKPEGVDILFFSEGAAYWHTFLPIIEALEAQGIASAYYTLDENDPALTANFQHLHTRCLGSGYSAFALLNRIEVDIVVMTTPQLDALQLKRSPGVKCYVHVVHAPTDALMYKKFAFDYFDVVMCSGPHQIKSLRALEQVRGLPEKTLLRTGLPYFDVMAREAAELPTPSTQQQTILVAPTWGATSMFSKYGTQILDDILATGMLVIVRPHPQSFISEPHIIDEIKAKIAQHPTLVLDTRPQGTLAMAEADVMISDVSGIIFDFFFIFKKPVLVFEGAYQPAGYEAEDVDILPWEIEALPHMATLIQPHHVGTLQQLVQQALATHQPEAVEAIQKESVFNFAKAGQVASEQLIQLLEKSC